MIPENPNYYEVEEFISHSWLTNKIFDSIVKAIEFAELHNEKYLVPTRVITVNKETRKRTVNLTIKKHGEVR